MNEIINEDATPQELFTKPVHNGVIKFIEREVNDFNFTGFEVVRKEFFSKANCPAVTFRYGSVTFNIRAIRKLDACSHILILINIRDKIMIIKPCYQEDKDSLQWCRINKHNQLVTRQIVGKVFTAQLYDVMKWNNEGVVKVLGTLETSKKTGEKVFYFSLIDAETYLKLSEPSEDDPKRRKRVPFPPEHWEGNFGKSYEESRKSIIENFEGVPEGFVKLTLEDLKGKKDDEKGKKNGTK